jgi:hypothetical protein
VTASGDRPPIAPPRPDLVRRPAGGFGWLEDRLLHDGWLARLGPPAIGVLVLLALAADRNGCSFYGRRRMADALGMRRAQLDAALGHLLALNLVAHRPWRTGCDDGVWQLLPVPAKAPPQASRQVAPSPALARRRPGELVTDAEPILVGEALRELVRSLAAAHGFPVVRPDSPVRAPRQKSALPDRQ